MHTSSYIIYEVYYICMLPVANYSMRLYDAAYYYFRVCICIL
jgi:hypothetical protein